MVFMLVNMVWWFRLVLNITLQLIQLTRCLCETIILKFLVDVVRLKWVKMYLMVFLYYFSAATLACRAQHGGAREIGFLLWTKKDGVWNILWGDFKKQTGSCS